MKLILVLILISLTPISFLFAQSIRTDSTAIKTELAIADAKRFKPTKQIRKAYRQHVLSSTSDYFNPTTQSVSDPEYLKDSTYVQSYKNTAYKNSAKRIKLNRKIITGSFIVAGFVALPFVVAKVLNPFYLMPALQFSNIFTLLYSALPAK